MKYLRSLSKWAAAVAIAGVARKHCGGLKTQACAVVQNRRALKRLRENLARHNCQRPARLRRVTPRPRSGECCYQCDFGYFS